MGFNIAFGFLLFHFLMWLVPFVFFLFVFVPWVMGLVDGKGYSYNAGRVWHGCMWVLSAGFKKRVQE